MNCPHCNVFNPDDARFCAACGKATSATEPVSHPNMKAVPEIIGKEIAGRYRILAKLGEGGMGAVYKAEQISLKRQCAVKLLKPDVAGTPIMLARFNAEAQAVAKLSHPNTVGIYDFGQDTDGTFFIAMEFVEGQSLREVIHSEAPLPPRRALAIAQQVAASLTDAHGHSIVHRDLKPDNVMLQTRGRQRDVARVLDFGIARIRDEGRGTQQAMTQAGDMLGTPQYMAPEQIRGEQIDGRTDVYALGCLLYEMITARMPFEAPTIMALLSKHLMENAPSPSQRRPELNLPPAIDHLIMAAIAKDPNARPPTMEMFGEQISHLLAQMPGADGSQASAPMSAVQPAVMPSGAPSHGTPQAYGSFTPAPIAPTAPVGAPAFVPPPPPGPAPMAPMAPMTPMPPPSYGTPPVVQSPYGFQQPAEVSPAPTKKSSAGMWIGIIAVVVLLGGTAAALVAFTGGSDNEAEASLDAGEKSLAEKPDNDKPDKPDKPDNVDKPTADAKPADPDRDGDGDGDGDSADPWAGDADVRAFIVDLQTLKTKMCACTTQACVTELTANSTKLSQALAKLAPKLARGDVTTIAKLTELQAEMAACATRVVSGTKPKTVDNSLNAQIDRFADRACACRNATCAQKVLTDLAIFVRANKDRDDEGDGERGKRAGVRMAQCLVTAGLDQATVVAAFQAMMR